VQSFVETRAVPKVPSRPSRPPGTSFCHVSLCHVPRGLGVRRDTTHHSPAASFAPTCLAVQIVTLADDERFTALLES
jgi:hypothetical protein